MALEYTYKLSGREISLAITQLLHDMSYAETRGKLSSGIDLYVAIMVAAQTKSFVMWPWLLMHARLKTKQFLNHCGLSVETYLQNVC